MVGHGQKLGRKKEAAIAALLTNRSVDEAARAAGVGATTLWRWLKLPEFQAGPKVIFMLQPPCQSAGIESRTIP